MQKKSYGLAGTLLLHGLIVFWMFYTSSSEKATAPPTSNEVQVTLIPDAPTSVKEEAVQVPNPGVDGAPDPSICKDRTESYQGIGIVHNIGTSLIISAPAGYPAYDNGLRVGDEIIQLYEEGHGRYVFIEVLRYPNIKIKKSILKQKICFKGKTAANKP